MTETIEGAEAHAALRAEIARLQGEVEEAQQSAVTNQARSIRFAKELSDIAKERDALRTRLAVLERQVEHWRQAVLHSTGCTYLTVPLPRCSCGSHAKIAALYADASKQKRETLATPQEQG